PEIGSHPHALDVLFKDSRNNLYLKKANKNIFFYRSATDRQYTLIDLDSTLSSLSIGSAIKMSEDREGNIWFIGNGMKRFNNRLQRFDLNLDSFLIHNIGNKFIASNLFFDSEGRMYFGVSNKGLVIYDPREKTFLQITRSNGLPDNSIAAVCLQNNKVWVGTESGIANYDLITKKVSVFGTAEGISIDGSVVYSLYYDSAYHQLYGAFNNTIFRFDPDKLIKNNSPPVFFIEKINIRGKEPFHHPDSNITVSYKYNNLVINLGVVNFDDAYTQLFAYRFIKKGNEPWEEAGSQRSIILSNLTPGNYKLQVKVYIRNKSWPEQIKEINITILPPFWQTTWFYVLSSLLLAGLAYYLHRRRINHITQKSDLDKQLAQTEMKALHSQMNPHFIFNCLNSIREMILNNENEQASLYLSKFARLIRITLDHSSRSFVSLDDTLDYLKRYLEMEHIRKSNFSYTIAVDENLQIGEIFLPPMLIQPFIENAIWHGAIPGKELHLNLKFKREQEALICIIDDDGMGIETALKNKEPELNYQSVGISNIKQRIHVLNEKYNLKSTVEIRDKSIIHSNGDTGTIVTLHLPIKTNEPLL
ncbi:MAG TPA: histidine kinase, partial [Chitinophagaceae bacterium]